MLRFSRAKIIATLGLILVGLMLAVPSFFSPEQRKGCAGASDTYRDTSPGERLALGR